MIDFRARHSSWYQVPVLYGWWDLTAQRRDWPPSRPVATATATATALLVGESA